jgi:hypothetical protein
MSLFNDDQQDYMSYLSRLPDREKCWCGWYLLHECQRCNVNHPGKSRANFLAQACPECRTLPPTHVKGCSKEEEPRG